MTESSQARIMPRRLSLCWTLIVLLLTACSSPEPQKPKIDIKSPRIGVKAPPKDEVKSYALRDDQAGQHLLNADTALQSGDTDTALRQLDLINPSQLDPEQHSQFLLLGAQIALSMGDAERAVEQLTHARPSLLAEADKIAYYQSLAFAQALSGNILPAVSARIRLGNLLKQPAQQQANIGAILDMLSLLPEEQLTATPDMAEELRGWLALARILKPRENSGDDLSAQIMQWRSSYPRHPANAEFLQAYLAAPQTTAASAVTDETPSSPPNGPFTAVLLPASGPYAIAAKAIREGLTAAQNQSANGQKRNLKFYDTEQGDINDLYQQVLKEGATHIIGPLIKEQIQSLASRSELTVPVLALNQVDHLSKNNLYQFGLSPVDEAEQLASKARRDGRQTAVLLVPNNAQGQRIGQYLANAWQNQGGILRGSSTYDPKLHDITQQLSALIAPRTEVNLPRTPQTLLLSASPEIARELAPQLKYHQTDDLAVYAMPNVYSGRQNPAQDADLGRVQFCDVPWLFADRYAGALSQTALQKQWQSLPEGVTRLFALGIDAYQLLPQLPTLQDQTFAGASGHLSLTADHRVTRKLVCAEFKAGIPVASGFVE